MCGQQVTPLLQQRLCPRRVASTLERVRSRQPSMMCVWSTAAVCCKAIVTTTRRCTGLAKWVVIRIMIPVTASGTAPHHVPPWLDVKTAIVHWGQHSEATCIVASIQAFSICRQDINMQMPCQPSRLVKFMHCAHLVPVVVLFKSTLHVCLNAGSCSLWLQSQGHKCTVLTVLFMTGLLQDRLIIPDACRLGT